MSTETLIVPDFAEVNALVLTSCFGAFWSLETHMGTRLALLRMPEPNPFGIINVNYLREGNEIVDASAPRFNTWWKTLEKRRRDGFGRVEIGLPDFCRDRNLVAEWLWPLLDQQDQRSCLMWNLYQSCLMCILSNEPDAILGFRRLHTSTPAKQTEAVLRTLGFWPANWASVTVEKKESGS